MHLDIIIKSRRVIGAVHSEREGLSGGCVGAICHIKNKAVIAGRGVGIGDAAIVQIGLGEGITYAQCDAVSVKRAVGDIRGDGIDNLAWRCVRINGNQRGIDVIRGLRREAVDFEILINAAAEIRIGIAAAIIAAFCAGCASR